MYFIIIFIISAALIYFFINKKENKRLFHEKKSQKKHIEHSVSHEMIECNINHFMKKNHIVDDIKKGCNVNKNTQNRDLQDESDYEEYIKDLSIQNKK